jgi:hypothetical protein
VPASCAASAVAMSAVVLQKASAGELKGTFKWGMIRGFVSIESSLLFPIGSHGEYAGPSQYGTRMPVKLQMKIISSVSTACLVVFAKARLTHKHGRGYCVPSKSPFFKVGAMRAPIAFVFLSPIVVSCLNYQFALDEFRMRSWPVVRTAAVSRSIQGLHLTWSLCRNMDAECDDARIVGLWSTQALETAGRSITCSPVLSSMCNLHNCYIYFPRPCI